jgi:hypothetical protein
VDRKIALRPQSVPKTQPATTRRLRKKNPRRTRDGGIHDLKGVLAALITSPSKPPTVQPMCMGSGSRSDQVPRAHTNGTIARRGPRLRIAESDAHAFIGEGRAKTCQAACLAHAQLVTCNLCCDLWTAGRVSAYAAVQSFRLILLCGSQDECGGTAHREWIVW